MRSIGILALVTGTLVLASACGDGAGTPPPDNTAPVANFDLPQCTINVACTFVSTSTDDAQVTEWSWDFDGDGSADASTASASFTYTTAADYNVSLTVRDAQGLSNTKSGTITIAPVTPGNPPPTAGFTYTCTAADCTFTSTSSDVAPGTIASYAWSFGDGATSDVSNPSHSYTITGPTDFTVTLTVADNDGATDVETQTVSVSLAPNTPPTAGFTHNCPGGVCSFTSTSTDVAPGTIVSFAWTFGDDATADVNNPTHSYAITIPTEFTVTLSVTDNEGATDVETQTFTVSPPPPVAEGCATSDGLVDCAFNIPTRSTVKLTILGLSCDLPRASVVIPPPIGDQPFLNICTTRKVGDALGIFGGVHDTAIIYEVGSQLRIRFKQGAVNRTVVPPAGRFEGSYPNWTISFEDGDHPGADGEPDFADVVLGVEATAR
jgi:PKD repeat protein